ncbi:PhzF family phenazine biosynthesis protein [Tistrella mobilis]|uniref:PhzF family phenazine biosynthesis protein n=1 Tax=Tistrella mobilis TaxID=171437 RepID=UPI0035592AB1
MTPAPISERPASERPAMAFCRADGSGGNPALVQLGGTEGRARALAHRHGAEVTWLQSDPDTGWRARFFLPASEITLCLHGLLAGAVRLWQDGEPQDRALVIATAAGPQTVSPVPADHRPPGAAIRLAGNHHRPIAGGAALRPDIAAATGLCAGLDAFPPALAGAARPKLVLRLEDPALVGRAVPDPAAVARLAGRTGATGLYLYALAGQAENGCLCIRARHFPAGLGIAEDPATGGAAAAPLLDLEHQGTGRIEAAVIDQGPGILTGTTSIGVQRLDPAGTDWLVSGRVTI